VQLDAPPGRVTDQPSFVVSGRITGEEAPDRLTLRLNGSARELALDGKAFQSSVTLTPGLNRIGAAVTGSDGVEREDTLVIEYTRKASAVTLVAPRDGLTLGPDDPLAVPIEGTVEDVNASAVWLVVNGDAVAVPVRDGRFRHFVAALEPLVRVWAESRSSGDQALRSQAVTITRTGMPATAALLILTWPDDAGGTSPDISATVRAAPARADAPISPVRLSQLGNGSGPASSSAYGLRNPRPGVYSFTARWPSLAASVEILSTLYVSDNGRVSRRVLRNVTARGAKPAFLARILLPQGVGWDDDGWFTGTTESVETIAKFRFPEGVTWTERKADLP
jgi:hypothetical protein